MKFSSSTDFAYIDKIRQIRAKMKSVKSIFKSILRGGVGTATNSNEIR